MKREIARKAVGIWVTLVGAATSVLGAEAPFSSMPSSGNPDGYLASAMHDPLVEADGIKSDAEADRVTQMLDEALSDGKGSKGSRRMENQKELMEATVRLTYFYEDVYYGRLSSDFSAGEVASRLSASRSKLVKFAKIYATSSKRPADKARALYFVSAAALMASPYSQSHVAGFRALSKMPLATYHQKRMELALALAGMEAGSGSARLKAAQSLQGLAGGLSADGKTYAAYRLANFYGRTGNQPLALEHLRTFASASSRLQPAQRDALLSSSVSIWLKATKGRGDWRNFPIALKPFMETKTAFAIRERQAISKFSHGDRPAAITDYAAMRQEIVEEDNGHLREKFDRRIVQWQQQHFMAVGRPDLYQRALMVMERAYPANENAEMNRFLRNQNRVLTFGELAQAKKTSATEAVRGRAIKMAEDYRDLLDQKPEQDRMNEEIAKVHVVAHRYSAAVAIFEQLASTNGGNAQEGRYLSTAIVLQANLAVWPKTIPWSQVKDGPRPEREHLARLYEQLASLQKNYDWQIHGQLARLQFELGSIDAAIASWNKGIDVAPAARDAAFAGGFLMIHYDHTKNWDQLEATIKTCSAKKIRAVYAGHEVLMADLLAKAFYEGGKQRYAGQDYAGAKTKLMELRQTFPNFKAMDHAQYLIASCHHQLGEHNDAVTAMLAFVEKYPNSRWMRAGLLQGGEWAVPMAYEENAIFFYEKFHARFGKDKESPRIWAELVELYRGRQLYADAIRIMKAQLADQADDAARASLMEEIMQVELRFGSLAGAAQVAAQLRSNRFANDDVKANALGVLVRADIGKGQLSSLDRFEAELRRLNPASVAVQSALGMLLFARAESIANSLPKKVESIVLADPLKTLNKQYAVFGSVRKNFEAVCDLAASAYCSPAYSRLAKVAGQMIDIVQDTNIAATLGDEEVNPFESRKDQIMEELGQLIEFAEFKSGTMVGNVGTSPVWAQAVHWEGSNDWHSDREGDSLGGGFSQWQGMP